MSAWTLTASFCARAGRVHQRTKFKILKSAMIVVASRLRHCRIRWIIDLVAADKSRYIVVKITRIDSTTHKQLPFVRLNRLEWTLNKVPRVRFFFPDLANPTRWCLTVICNSISRNCFRLETGKFTKWWGISIYHYVPFRTQLYQFYHTQLCQFMEFEINGLIFRPKWNRNQFEIVRIWK